MQTLVYRSGESWRMTREDLFLLLQESRKNNLAFEITGLLLYGSASFIQVIEGDKNPIDQLYRNIQSDIRNRDVKLLVYQENDERKFENWAMGFVAAHEEEKRNIPGLSRFLDTDFDTTSAADPADSIYRLLLDFREKVTLRDMVDTGKTRSD